jgi:hypothetical protein
MMFKGLAAVASVGAVAIGLGGCVAFDGPIEGKQVRGDKVKISFALCDDRVEENCQDSESSAKGDEPPPERYLLLGFRMPKGTDEPDFFRPKDVDGVTFLKSFSYGNQLDKKAPRKESEKWYGYISTNIAEVPATRAEFGVRFGLPKDVGKTFRYRPVVGVLDKRIEGGKVDCGSDPFTTTGNSEGGVVCIDDPTREEVETNLKIPLD